MANSRDPPRLFFMLIVCAPICIGFSFRSGGRLRIAYGYVYTYHQRLITGGGRGTMIMELATTNDHSDASTEKFISRVVPIDEEWNITVYEMQQASDLIEGYWESESR